MTDWQATRDGSGYTLRGWEHSDAIPRLNWDAPARWDGGSWEVMVVIQLGVFFGVVVTLVHVLDSVGAI